MLEKTGTKLESMFKTENQLGSDGIPHEIDGTTIVSFSQGCVLAALHNSIRPSLSIEIGLAYGFSTLFILDSMFENNYGKHVAIDPTEVTHWHGIALKSIHDLKFDDRFEWHEALSIDVLSTMRRNGVRAQYIYIDGQHTFDAALIDFCCSDKILDIGGVIILDDMWLPSIRTVVSFIKNNFQHYKQVQTDCSNICCFKKTGDDIRSWDHFIKFNTSYDVSSIRTNTYINRFRMIYYSLNVKLVTKGGIHVRYYENQPKISCRIRHLLRKRLVRPAKPG